MKRFLTLIALFAAASAFAQKKPAAGTNGPAATPATARMAGLEKKKMLEQRSLVSNVTFRSVGPTVMSGRVVDIEVDPSDATKFFVAYASGGLWYTDNNGTTFRPIFDQEASMTIGDFDVNWDAKGSPEIWIGTGECNSSRSSYSGTGMYHSTDFGKHWENLGLAETHHIGRVLYCREYKDPGTLLVAAIGHLYSPNKERGVYKTTDGGKTWKQTLFIDDNTGVIDLQMDPNNSSIIYAMAWHRERRAWNFVESGKSSGIYKSTDGGDTWKLITTPQSGFPQGDGIGRIGISIFGGTEGNPHSECQTLYAIVDNQTPRTEPESKEAKLKPADFRKMSRDQFLKLEPEKLKSYLSDNGFPEKYSAEYITEKIKDNTLKPSALADYLEDANRSLLSSPIVGAEVYRSDDAGATWKKTNDKNLDNFFFTYGYYFGKIWVSPFDDKEIFIAGVSLQHSTDGGKTFSAVDGDNQHGDHHVLRFDLKRKGHLINGSDGGVHISWDNGKTWFKANTPAVGQFYSVVADMDEPYNVYGGLQDNGVWTGPSTYQASLGWYSSGHYPYKFILGGDGMQVQVDPRDNNTVYSGYQFGYYYRINKTTGETKLTRPQHELGETPLRFNWQAPIWLSVHNKDILYMGSNKLHRSMNQGRDWQAISGDLTAGGITGDVPYGTITAIHESPMRFGLLYTGSDDGYIHVSRDGGTNWLRISDGLPQKLRVNRVQASAFKEGRVYAALSGFQWDDFNSYLYSSEDFGATWTRIGLDLPMEPVNVVREDPVNENVLYVGTDNGLYVSLDRGKSFMRMTGGLPAVAVHDLVIQPRAHDIVVGTHGRSIWIANVEALEDLQDSIIGKPLYAFDFETVKLGPSWREVDGDWVQVMDAGTDVRYFTKQPGVTSIRLETTGGTLLHEMRDTSEAGLNFARFEVRVDSTNLGAYEKELAAKSINAKVDKKDMKNILPVEGEYNMKLTTSQGATLTKKIILKKRKDNSPGERPEPREKD